MSEEISTPIAAKADQPATAPLTPEQRKAKRNATMTKWAGAIVGTALLIRVGVGLLPHGLAACDASDLQAALRTSIETTSKLKLTNVSDIKTVSRGDNTATCSMHVNVSDGSQAQIAYRLDLVKGETNYRVTDVQ
jgi:hypothetical protein